MKINHYLKATSLEEAMQAMETNPQAMLIGGGAWMKLTYKKVDTLISLDDLHLDEITDRNGFIDIGAMCTLHQIETSPLIQTLNQGILVDAIKQIMGVAVRNIATIGGSIVSKFGFSDLYPVLLLMNPILHFYRYKDISLQSFLASNEVKRDILVSVSIPKQNDVMFFKKVKTTSLDFAILNIGVSKGKDGFKVVIGSRPGIAMFAQKAMNLLNSHNPLTNELMEEASRIASQELAFSSNVRSTEEYRIQLAQIYTLRGLKEVSSL